MMRSGTVFYKTERGEREIQQRRGELSLRDRRILMLINGARTLEEIEQLARTARVENASSILDALVSAGFISYQGAPAAGRSPAPSPAAPPSPATPTPTAAGPAGAPATGTPASAQLSETQTFMLDSLRAYTNPRRVMDLSRRIAEAGSDAELRDYLDPWCEAISESPQGIFHADDLRVKLLEKLVRGS